jgi:Ca2+-binding EF-hand superfamily protein
MKAVLSKTLSFIFDTIDFNRDGDISKDEFSTYFKSLRINDDGIIQHVFTAMDTNNDGTVNKQGILFLFLRFFIKSKLNFIQK